MSLFYKVCSRMFPLLTRLKWRHCLTIWHGRPIKTNRIRMIKHWRSLKYLFIFKSIALFLSTIQSLNVTINWHHIFVPLGPLAVIWQRLLTHFYLLRLCGFIEIWLKFYPREYRSLRKAVLIFVFPLTEYFIHVIRFETEYSTQIVCVDVILAYSSQYILEGNKKQQRHKFRWINNLSVIYRTDY